MSIQPPLVLVTGFGTFPGASQNPSETLATAIAGGRQRSDYEIVCGILPTSWQKVETALTKLFTQHNPDFALHLGYAATSPGFALESTAYNQTCGEPDVEGVSGICGPVITDAPAQFLSTAPLAEIETALSKSGFKATRSDDPGRYLCNMAYYLSLSQTRSSKTGVWPHSSLFVHIPAIKTSKQLIPQEHEGTNQLSLGEAQSGLALIIDTLLDEYSASMST